MRGTKGLTELLKERVRKIGKERAMIAIECASRVLRYFEKL